MPLTSTYAVRSEALREWRERRGLTLRQLGAKTGRHPQAIRKLETENGKRIGRVFAWQIANALDVHPSAFTDCPPGAAREDETRDAEPARIAFTWPEGLPQGAKCTECSRTWSPGHTCKVKVAA